MASSTSVDWQGTDVDVPLIERKLSSLWSQLSRDASLASPVRTTIFNLVVYAADKSTAAEISQQLDALPGRQPSRVIILVPDRLSPHCVVDATASVRCHVRGDGMSLCDERLVLTARNRAAEHWNSVVIPLLIADIPTYLWWPGQPPFGHRVFHRLLSVADQLMVDSGEFQSPGLGFADLARLCRGSQGVHDFHWARLTQWREVMAQFFDGPSWLPYSRGIVSMQIEFGSGGEPSWPTAGALLLLGWMASHLGWEPETTLDELATQDLTLSVLQGERLIPIDLHFRDHGARGAGRLRRIEFVSQPKGIPPARFRVERSHDLEHVHVSMHVHGGQEIRRVVPMTNMSGVELLADELDLAGHDRLYEVVVNMAGRMAGREVWQAQ